MRRARHLLVSVLLSASVLCLTAQGAFATYVDSTTNVYRGDVWSNSDAFAYVCNGITDTYPQQLYSLAKAQMAALGYAPIGGAVGPSFTRANFLASVLPDYGVYVHSHGDNYRASSGSSKIDSAFLQDPGSGKCNNHNVDTVRSSAIKAATMGAPYNLVIMSTCRLGSSSSTMPDAFQIAKVKNSTQPEFFLGYVNLTYDGDMLRFEKAFWSYLNASSARTALQAFTYASSIGGFHAPDSANPFQANWWGNPTFNGRPA